MLKTKLLRALAGDEKLYVDDVFSTYLYIGNGSTQTITNGIDLAGKGGLVWIKNRTTSSRNNTLTDTTRGATKTIYSDATLSEQTVSTALTAFTSSGFSVGSSSDVNASAGNIVSWTFRKAPKFFDVVIYTGNGIAGRQMLHDLGVAPGMLIVKRVNDSGVWGVWHRSLGADQELLLNSTASVNTDPGYFSTVGVSDTNFAVGSYINEVGSTYVAYIFAHDVSADGMIQCGSFTTDGSGNATVNLGWEPQYILQKSSSAAGAWVVNDALRGMSVGGTDARLLPNTSGSEGYFDNVDPTSTGFIAKVGASSANIYLAIRRPNKPPATGTQVYNAIARTGTGVANFSVTGVGFPPDLGFYKQRNGTALPIWSDRMRGAEYLLSSSSQAAQASSQYGFVRFGQDGGQLGTDTSPDGGNSSSGNFINHFFKRAPGVFDVVCYTGTAVAATVAHNLGVVPELMILKARNSALGWYVLHKDYLTADSYQKLETTATISTGIDLANGARPTATVLSLGTSAAGNGSATTYVAYLFATKAGISKVGSYTGNGSSQTINCGFTTGARFILIKRTDSTGDWYIWDTARGIVTGNDPHLSLNATAAEVTTDDSIDPDTSGFIVNQVAATNINVNTATYIYLAIA